MKNNNVAKEIAEFVTNPKGNNVTIQNQSMTIKEYQGQRVVTFSDVERLHQRTEGVARQNFMRNKNKFIEGTDYLEVLRKDVGDKLSQTYGFDKKAPKGILLTESGYLLLVKSFTDDLAWKVQRELVNAYFRSKTMSGRNSSDDLKAKRVETAQANANVRKANLLLKIADSTQTAYKQVLQAHVTKLLTGEFLLPLPAVDERTYSAGEIAELLGVSANKIGRLSNENGMKTEYYGKWFYDKSRHSDKQVETFRYYEKAIEVFRKLLEVAA